MGKRGAGAYNSVMLVVFPICGGSVPDKRLSFRYKSLGPAVLENSSVGMVPFKRLSPSKS
jgi:hypothetical protein